MMGCSQPPERSLKRFYWLPAWLVVWLTIGCTSPPAGGFGDVSLGDSLDLRGRADQYLRGRVARGFSGVVLIAKGGEILLHEAYSREASITTESVFWIGSVTKPIAAAAILRLRDDGHLALSDSINRFFDQVPPDKQSITIRHLLTHTAGFGETYAADGIADRPTAVQAILARPLRRPPGAEYGYSNDAYNLLAAVVEVVADQPYEVFVRERILSPAGMHASGFWGEVRAEDRLAPVGKRFSLNPGWGFKGATGISSTAADLYRWHLAMGEDVVLPDSTRRQAASEQVQKRNGGAYGYGWQVARTARGTRLLAHSGAESELRHFAFLYRFIDEDIVVIALSNSPEGIAQETFGGLLRVLFP